MDQNAQLDYAMFQILSSQNRYDSLVCIKGRTEKLVSGSLDQLSLVLSEAKEFQSNSSNGTFKLQLKETLIGSAWFTKHTLLRFLHIVNTPAILKSASTIINEMAQLEETRKFHVSLYSKEQSRLAGGLTGGFLDSVGISQQVNAGTVTSEATKNELLRALDLRLTVLKEEMAVSFNKSIGSKLSTKEISDLASFIHHFASPDSRDYLLKFLEAMPSSDTSEPLPEPNNISIEEPEPVKASNGVSPAKLAQVERQSSTESEDEDSSNSSEREDEQNHTVTERSRPLIRAASPRRSASPMRRVQIGRSGSRRSPAIAIKSISYFPARERITADRDADETNSNGGEDETDRSTKKTEVNVKRMSVQDAISLFESKQKEQGLDVNNNKNVNNNKKVMGFVSTNKSVLRRWSAGMGDSLTNQPQESISVSDSTSNNNDQSGSSNFYTEEDNKVDEINKVLSEETRNNNGNLDANEAEIDETVAVRSPPVSVSTAEVELKSQQEETADRAAASAEWTRQKEAELNEMLLKMMGTKAGKCGTNTAEQEGGLYSQCKEKRDAKLRSQSTVKQNTKEPKSKVAQSGAGKSASVVKKSTAVKEKRASPSVPTQKPRRNSSPPVVPKKEASKATTPASSRKASPRASPLPPTRSSLSSGPAPAKSNNSQKTKSSTTTTATVTPTSSTNTPTSRRKPQSTTPLSTQPSPRTERVTQKNKKETTVSTKPAVKAQIESKPRAAARTSRGAAKPKDSPSQSLVDESGVMSKPSFYNKVTKKSSVVPLESKPSVKKTTPTKSKIPQPDSSPKDSEPVTTPTKPTVNETEVNLSQQDDSVDANLKIPPDNNVSDVTQVEKPETELDTTNTVNSETLYLSPPTAEIIQTEDEIGISSAAWVEADHHEIEPTCENDHQLESDSVLTGSEVEPIPSSSPKIRHSLSQMLQADTHEPEIIEWGNAENPPALVFQKDSPKGFKRLLKFARKNKGEANVNNNNNNGWATSPSVFSEGEEDLEEVKGSSMRNLGAFHAKGYGLQRGVLSESFDGGVSSKRSVDVRKSTQSFLSAQSGAGNLNSLASREGQASSAKASRSFFSLSNFRSSKSNETKSR